MARAAVEQRDLDAVRLHAIPELTHFRGHRTGRKRFFDVPVRMGQAQEIVEMDAYAIARVHAGVQFFGKTLRLVEDV